MNIYLIIGIVVAAAVVVALVLFVNWGFYRVGSKQGAADHTAEDMRREADAARKAGDAMAQPISDDDVADKLDKGEF